MIDHSDKPIGGYQGLELPFFEGNIGRRMIKTNSARSAIKVILRAIKAKKILLPAYTCDAVVKAVEDLGITYTYYRINSTFDVDAAVRLEQGEYILIVDYFGMSGDSVTRSLKRFGHAKTLVDCSQAYFSAYTEALATVWSPRKFFGLPDGGLIYSADPRIKEPTIRDETSETRMGHLINRLSNNPETSYQKYLEAEQEIANMPVLGMSRLTERLLHSVNYESAKIARSKNARYLHSHLSEYNTLKWNLNNNIAPLCYPFLPKARKTSRSALIDNKVFMPSYWPEVLTRVDEGSFEWELVNNCLFLPCDQRYTEHDMSRIISLLAIQEKV